MGEKGSVKDFGSWLAMRLRNMPTVLNLTLRLLVASYLISVSVRFKTKIDSLHIRQLCASKVSRLPLWSEQAGFVSDRFFF
jgi:hypothetical protein